MVMNKKPVSIDGFIRRSRSTNGVTKKRPDVSYYQPKVATKRSLNSVGSTKKQLSASVSKLANRELNHQRSERQRITQKSKTVDKQDFDVTDFLNQPSTPSRSANSKPSKPSKAPKAPKPKSKKRKIIKWLFLGLLVVGLATVYHYGSRLMKATNVIGGGNLIDVLFKADPLKTDENGRTNFLVFGTESNNVNSAHGGPLLTDSLMIISFDSKTNKASIVSIPRDLWVRLESTCFVGNRAKVNTVYQCGSNNGKDPKAGAEALGRKLGQVTGWTPQYYMHLNFKAVEDIVNAIGGVEIVIESPDPRGIYDVNTGIKFKNGPTGLLNGEQALKLIRARNSDGGYGLSRSNYDREDNQRRVVTAMAKKMASDGTFNNFEKMLRIIESLGDNLRTNITTSEVKSVAATFKKISSQFSDSTINSISLVEVTKTGNMDGQSVVLPRAGFENYTEVKKHVQRQANGNQELTKESASVTVLNGSDVAGIAQKLADRLTEQGFTVRQIANAPENISTKGLIFQKAGADKPKSYEFLKRTYQLETDIGQSARYTNYNSDLVVVIGPGFELK